jgi:predicted phosphate transport protein (TIGR00153 family)
MSVLFRKTKDLEREIDEFLDLIVQGGLVFRQGLKLYLSARQEEFEQRRERLEDLEHRADILRRSITGRLYGEMLIPQSRGDVLGLLESSDKVLNRVKETLVEFSVQLPEIPADTQELFTDLSASAISAVEEMVMGVRAYFRNPSGVHDHINKACFYEKESDGIAEKIKRIVFRSEELHLSARLHLRLFAKHIDDIADAAEDVCDRLAIAAIKRDV